MVDSRVRLVQKKLKNKEEEKEEEGEIKKIIIRFYI